MESHSTSLVFPPTTSFPFLFRPDNEDAALLPPWKDFSLWCGSTHGRSRPHPPLFSAPCCFAGLYPSPAWTRASIRKENEKLSTQENANRAEPARVRFLPPLAGRGELLLGRGEGKGLGLPIPIGPHKRTGAVERFHRQHFCT